MARGFVESSNQYLQIDQAAVSGYPLTMACWARPTDDQVGIQYYMQVADKDVAEQYYGLGIDSLLDGVLAIVNDTGPTWAETINPPTLDAWNHLAAVFPSADSRSSYLNGGIGANDKATNTDAGYDPTGLDRTAIGAFRDSTPGFYADADLAEAAIWNVALTDFEVWLMGKLKLSPQWIRPQNIVFYAPLLLDEDYDMVGGLQMTPTNSPTVVPHPPGIIYPRQRLGFAGPYSPRRVRPLVKGLM